MHFLNTSYSNWFKAKKEYEKFVLTNTDMNSPLEGSFKGIAIGGKSFIDKIKEKIKIIGRKREIAETKTNKKILSIKNKTERFLKRANIEC